MHPNEALLRRGYDAFSSGDLEAIAAMLSEDVVWHVGGETVLAGDYKGHAEVFALFARLAQATDGTIRIAARDILANDDHGIVLTRTQAALGEKHLDTDGVAVFNIVDGRATEVWVFADDQEVMDAFVTEALTRSG